MQRRQLENNISEECVTTFKYLPPQSASMEKSNSISGLVITHQLQNVCKVDPIVLEMGCMVTISSLYMHPIGYRNLRTETQFAVKLVKRSNKIHKNHIAQ